jgi:hypothetical protein
MKATVAPACCGPAWKHCGIWRRQIEAVLIHSPDRLNRKYAYQVLLAEELARLRRRAHFSESLGDHLKGSSALLVDRDTRLVDNDTRLVDYGLRILHKTDSK